MSDDPALQSIDDDPTDAEVSSIATLARRVKELEAEIAVATTELRTKIVAYRQLVDRDLPNALRTAGVAGLPLADGTQVKLQTAYDANKLTDPEGLRWVEENGGGSLIKTQITLEMDRGDLEAAREILSELRANRNANRFLTLTLTESVHDKTIAAFARRLIEEQRKEPPLEKLGVRRRVYAIVGQRPKLIDLKGFERV